MNGSPMQRSVSMGIHALTELTNLVGTVSGVLWILTYILIIRLAFKQKIYAMPLVPMGINATWEFIFAFIYPAQVSGPSYWISLAVMAFWFLLDVVIAISFLKFWDADWPAGIPGSWRYPILIGTVISAFAIIMGMQREFGDPLGGVYASFFENVFMSGMFIQMYMRRNSNAGQSLGIAVTKMLGTVLASVYWFLQGKTGLLWMSLYISIFVMDLTYTLLLQFRKPGARTA